MIISIPKPPSQSGPPQSSSTSLIPFSSSPTFQNSTQPPPQPGIQPNAFKQEVYQINGTVIKKKWKKGDKDSLLTILSLTTHKEYTIICSFFCPTREGDAISGLCTNLPDGRFTFLKEPSVEPGSTPDTVKTSFMIALKGTGNFGQYKADKLYNFFETEARKRIASLPCEQNDTVFRNKDLIPAAVVEMISLYALRFRSNDTTLAPLLNAGLSEEQARTLLTWWYTQCSLRRLYLLGLTWTEIQKSVQRGWDINALYYQLIENPYLIETVPLDKARNISAKYELQFSREILACGELVRHIDKECENRAWSCYPISYLHNSFANISELLPVCVKLFNCSIRFDSIYLRHQNETENTLAHFFEKKKCLETFCSEYTKKTLCDEQINAVNMALNNNISIITGGAGVGKTTVIRAIAREFDLRGIKYVIAAYTGKAVARIKQVFENNIRPMTLSMLLNRGPRTSNEIDALIIDEISMVPNELLARVLQKIYEFNTVENWVVGCAPRTKPLKVVFVGDASQLPPIDAGNLFNELLNTSLPITRLMIDHRRKDGENNVLKYNTHQFAMKSAGLLKDIEFKFGGNCLFYEGDIPEIESIVRALHNDGIKKEDVVVLCPYNEPLEELNMRCRNIFLPNAQYIIDAFGKRFDIGAKVMMLVNNYDLGVMNGDEGIVQSIAADGKTINVSFNGASAIAIPTSLPEHLMENTPIGDDDDFGKEMILSTKNITLSFACSVHKYQGSEIDYVIFFLPKKKISSFLNANLFYTGISRAKKMLYIVGSSPGTVDMIIGYSPIARYDKLAERLNKEVFSVPIIEKKLIAN